MTGDPLLLTRTDVAALLDLEGAIEAVEAALRLEGEGRARRPALLGFPVAEGAFHIKAAALDLSRPYFAAKVNANFSSNPSRFGLPAIQGVVVLCDAGNGEPLALMDSIQITILRTGAATAVAARRLARPDARVATVCGCGAQARSQLRALCRVLPIREVFAWDADTEAAGRFAAELSAQLAIRVTPVQDPGPAAASSAVVVTCTPSRRPYLRREDISPGAFVAAVGADAPEKRELCPGFLGSAKVFVDSLEQCAAMGELHHALEEGTLTRSEVAAELSEVVAGGKPGRESEDEVLVFDSTGIALEDVAAAVAVYEKAVRLGRGKRIALAK
ncbi:MAG: ornithine cyclodeaminase family protein [Thermoanaerobaculia bacterium]